MAAARAHVERIVYERFSDGVAANEDESIQPVLEQLRALFALSKLEEDRAWFLEAGYFTVAKSRAIRAQVNALTAEIRPAALALVDGFGIPARLLGGIAAN